MALHLQRERESVGTILFVAASFIPGCDLREDEAEGSVRASEAVFREQTAGMVASSEEREPERPAAARRYRTRGGAAKAAHLWRAVQRLSKSWWGGERYSDDEHERGPA